MSFWCAVLKDDGKPVVFVPSQAKGQPALHLTQAVLVNGTLLGGRPVVVTCKTQDWPEVVLCKMKS